MVNIQDPYVSICCITYNHEKYIHQAIDGFLSQKTDFPIEIVIGEDFSTDSTRTIILSFTQEHPDLFRLLLHDRNIGVMQNFSETLKACKGKYIALCEGDDYWTDPLKLQKQVDFMEAHPECSICCHKVLHKYEGHEEKNHLFPDLVGNQIYTREDFFRKYISSTCSLVFRRTRIDELVKYLEEFYIGDIPLICFYLEQGNMGYLDEVMGVYRKNDDSWWYPRYEERRFPVLFDTYSKVKKYFHIRNSPALDIQISYYADELLKKAFDEKDFKAMRAIILKSGFAFTSAKKHRQRRLFYFSIIAFFPWIYTLYHSIKK